MINTLRDARIRATRISISIRIELRDIYSIIAINYVVNTAIMNIRTVTTFIVLNIIYVINTVIINMRTITTLSSSMNVVESIRSKGFWHVF